jgi:hypothetical protein
MLNEIERKELVKKFVDELIPMAVLATEYSISRQAVHKIIRKSGVDIVAAARVAVICAVCNKTFVAARNRVRATNTLTCSRDCYHTFLKRNNYKENKGGSRLARKLVSLYHTLRPGEVVHHIDGDQSNNKLENLMVFASAADHVRYHRGFDIKPVWKF